MNRIILCLLLLSNMSVAHTLAAAASGPSRASARLTELEQRVPMPESEPTATAEFHQQVLKLIETNQLVEGRDFVRAVALLAGGKPSFPIARTRYEVLLGAIARNEPGSSKMLAEVWGDLRGMLEAALIRDGNSMPLDAADLGSIVDAVMTLYGNTAAARARAKKKEDSPEIKTIADHHRLFRRKDPVRFAAEWSTLTTEAEKRRARLRELVQTNALHTVQDFSDASQVLEHSERLADRRLAHELALCSLLLGNYSRGRWPVAATYDKLTRALGRAQRFGSQFDNDVLLPVDESGICDNQRQALGCAPVSSAIGNDQVRKADALVTSGKFAEAETLARDGFARRAIAFPADDWRVFSAQRVLGASLLGQNRFADAEPMLLEAYAGLKAAAAKIPDAYKGRVVDTLDLLVKLYELSGQAAKAEEWKSRK